MNAPDPKANTTTEAYLAYKAGYLEESELKPVLYEPYLHFDAWLAYWDGLTDTYPTDENGDPEMLTDEEALVAYLSGVTDTYPEEIKDPYDVRITGYLRYLVSARFGRPDYPVNNEEFYLSTMKPPVVPSGDTPSSDIEMDDTAKAPFIDLKMYGDTSQQTYSGKNLLPYPYADGDSKTTRGITYTVNADGTVTLDGQNDGTASSAFYFVDRWGSMPLFELSAGTYYFIPNSEGVEYEMYDGSHYYTLSSNNSFTVTFQSSVSIRQVYIVIRKSNQTQFNNYKLYPMLTTSANPTVADYEPYTGGIPAPNPDYPQPVNVVTGRQVVGVKGKNLFYGSNNTSGGIVSAWEGSKVTLEGTTTSTYANITGIDPIPTVFEAGTYTFSTDTLTNEYSKVIRIREDGENHSYTIPKGDRSITFTTSGSFTVRICFISGLSQNVGMSDTFGLQLELGSEPTAYSPYGGESYEINLGKNLFNNLLSPIYSTGATSEPLSTGIRINATETKGNCFCGFRLFKSSDFIGKTITLSANVTASASNQPNAYIGICAENGSSRVAKVFMTGTGEKSVSYTHTEEDASRPYIMVALYSNYAGGTPQVGTYADFNNLQLEVGSTATPYAPYFEPIELCKLGDYQDYIYRDEDGDWYVHKACNKVVFDGTENWGWNSNQVFNLGLTDNFPNRTTTNPYCDNFIGQTSSGFNQVLDKHISLQSTATPGSERVLVKYLALEQTAPAFKTWLSTHNTTLYYPLATPTDTQITNSELITQLNALMEGGSYEGKTYIKVTATDPNLPGLLYVEAGKYD